MTARRRIKGMIPPPPVAAAGISEGEGGGVCGAARFELAALGRVVLGGQGTVWVRSGQRVLIEAAVGSGETAGSGTAVQLVLQHPLLQLLAKAAVMVDFRLEGMRWCRQALVRVEMGAWLTAGVRRGLGMRSMGLMRPWRRLPGGACLRRGGRCLSRRGVINARRMRRATATAAAIIEADKDTGMPVSWGSTIKQPGGEGQE